MFVKLVLRQRDVLRLASCHVQILINRPFLLKSFASSADPGASHEQGTTRQEEMQANTQRCVDAATQIIEHIDHIYGSGELYSTLFVRDTS